MQHHVNTMVSALAMTAPLPQTTRCKPIAPAPASTQSETDDRFSDVSRHPSSRSPKAGLAVPAPAERGRVRFRGDESRDPVRGIAHRRYPTPVSADTIRDAWTAIRGRVQQALGKPPSLPSSLEDVAPPLTPEEAFDRVDDLVEACATQVAAATARAKMQRKLFEGVLNYAMYLHAREGLPESERHFDDANSHSKTAMFRGVLASLDQELERLRQRSESPDQGLSATPDLISDGESDAEEDWVAVTRRNSMAAQRP